MALVASSQADLREKAAQLSDQAKSIRAALHRAMTADEITLGMYREACANINHATYALDCARASLSEFMPLDARELAEAGEASHRG